MRKIELFLFMFFVCGNLNAKIKSVGYHVLGEHNKKIQYVINNQSPQDWVIDHEENPDRLYVYCEKKNTVVTFLAGNDKFYFKLNDGDTVQFTFVITVEGKKEYAHTEVIGVKSFPNSMSMQEKLYRLGLLWSETKYNFVNMDKISLDWDSLYTAYIPQVMNTKNDYEYYRVLQKFMANLQDGHSEVFTEREWYSTFMDYIPLNIQNFDNRFFITDIRKGINIDSSFVGSEIVEIAGIKTSDYMKDSIFPYISASTSQHLWMQGVYKLQSGIKNTTFKAKVRKRDGRIAQISLLRNGEMTRTASDEYYGKELSEEDKDYQAVRFKWLPDSIAYLEVRAFYPEEFIIKRIYSLQDSIVKAKKLIIDLRRNGGGSTDVAWFLQSYLTKGDYFLNYAWETRINDAVKRANGNWIDEYADYYKSKAYRKEKADTVFIGDTILRFTMPVAILIGKYTLSATEDFLVNLYEVPDRPVLIGEPTGGSTGSPLLIGKTFDEAFARVCTRRICFPYSGKPFVNEGIQPDIFIQQNIDDYLNNKDVVLEKAVEYLQAKE